MNYYQRHIGDYIKDAGHLSLLEHGVFARLLDVYYGREAPIPDDQKYRLIMARTDEEKATVDAILIEFFKRDGDAWSNKRCDEEIFRAQEKSRKAAESAGARWDNSERNADAMPTQCEGNAPISHKPITNNQVTNPPTPQGGLDEDSLGKPVKPDKPPPDPRGKFEDFWAEFKSRYPKRGGGELCAAEAERKLKRAWKDPKFDPVPILEGLSRFKAYAHATDRAGTNFVPMMTTWLNQKRWTEEYEIPAEVLQLVPGGKDPIGPTVGLYDPAGTQVYVPESDQDRLLAEGWTTHPHPKEKPKVRGDLKTLEEKVAWQ